MNEQDLRSLVREAIDRHLRQPGGDSVAHLLAGAEAGSAPVARRRGPFGPADPHASHLLLKVLPGSDEGDGLCVIEPAVRCNHCGFCQSYGH
jgi:hypothetical protein